MIYLLWLLLFMASMFAMVISLAVKIIVKITRKETKRRWGRRCLVSLICIIVLIVIGIFLPSTSCDGEHTWREATCTGLKMCEVCGTTEGEPLGHNYDSVTTDPTCMEDGRVVSTCSRCGDIEETKLEALGHNVSKWTVVTQATCSAEGEEVGICEICGNATVSRAIEKTSHTEGEWTITKEATPTSSGKRSMLCVVCGEELKHENYTMTDEEIKKICETYTYKEIARRPGDYEGKYAKFTGQVIQVVENSTNYTLRVNVTIDDWGFYDDTIYVTYTAPANADRILEDDIVTIYGQLTGTKTYDSIFGAQITIPSMKALYIEINN